jgi:hypothetical protein
MDRFSPPALPLLNYRGALDVARVAVIVAPTFFGPPLPEGWPLDVEAARNFVSSLWQVEAAAIGLSVAIILFVFEAFASSRFARHGETLRDFASDVGLFSLIDVGIAALIVSGLTLLGVGANAPSGWSLLWTVFVGAAALMPLPLIYRRTLRAVDPGLMQERRLARLRNAAVDSVRALVVQRTADQLLEEFCAANGIVSMPFLSARHTSDHHAIRPSRRGAVADVDLRQLQKLARELGAGGIHISAQVGARTYELQPVLLLPRNATQGHRRTAQKLVRIGDWKADKLSKRLEGLRDEGREAIRDEARPDYARAAEALRELLITIAGEWLRRGESADEATNIGRLWDESSVTEAATVMFDHMRRAIRSSDIDLMRDVIYLPLSLGSGIARLSAPALLHKVLSVIPPAYGLAADAEGQVGNDARERIPFQFMEFISFGLEAPLAAQQARSEQMAYLQQMEIAFDVVNDLLKEAIDRGDLRTVQSVDAKWSEVLQYWQVSDPATLTLQLRLLEEERPDDTASIERVRQAVVDASDLVTRSRQLGRTRQELRFSLATWAYHRFRTGGDPEKFRPIITHFLPELGDVQAGLAMMLSLLGRHGDERLSLSSWLVSSLGPGAHMVPTDAELMRLFLLLAISLGSPDLPPSISPSSDLLHRVKDLETLLQEVRGDGRTELLVPNRMSDRIRQLHTGIQTAASKQRQLDHARYRSAPLNAQLQSRMLRDVIAAWKDSRWLPRFVTGARYVELIEDFEPDAVTLRISSPRSLLVDEAVEYGGAFRDWGQRLAEMETAVTFAWLRENGTVVEHPGVLRERVIAAIELMRSGGCAPDAVFVPRRWNVLRELGLEGRDEMVQGTDLRPIGSISDVPIFRLNSAEREWLVLVAWAGLANWRQRLTSDALPIELVIEDAEEGADGEPMSVVRLSESFSLHGTGVTAAAWVHWRTE